MPFGARGPHCSAFLFHGPAVVSSKRLSGPVSCFLLFDLRRRASSFSGTQRFETSLRAISQEKLSHFAYRALEFFESLEDDAAVSDTLKDALSTRELACLRFAAEGKSSDDIAVVLGVSAFAISSYFRSAAEKLEAANRMQAIAKAIRLKLI